MNKSPLLTKQSVADLIAENYNTYKSYSRITSDYRGEKGLTEAYNGRQLLEMLQNADDAQTDKVSITLNTTNNILSIANNGVPFDIKGLGSLMLANNSPKNKRDFIGNKGLGFRSILNWVDVVRIKTKSCVLEFSKEIARKEFEQLIPDSIIRQQIIDNEKDLTKGDYPIAILAIPDFKENTQPQDWETIVELKYKKSEEEKIIGQLKTISPEVLLFLNHIISIQIAGSSEIDNELVLTPSRDLVEKTLTVNNSTWNLFDSGEKKLPNNTEKFYKYKIAWQNDLSDTETCFATYFPTQVATHLPYLIHATFDLDPSRNHLNKSDDNEYILNQIATTLKDITSTEIVNNNQPDWKALDFLTIDGKSENPHLVNFFQRLENAKTELAIYPTVDGNYKKINEVKYYGNEFSKLILNNNLEEYFFDLLLPVPSHQILTQLKITSKYTVEEWESIFDVVTHKIESIEVRVELIKLLTSDLFKDFHGIHLPLLLDDKDKRPVSSDFETYILKKADTDSYQIPDYAKIAFIDSSLYNKLLSVFSEEIDKEKGDNKENVSRILKKNISRVVNFGSNDITDVVRNITRAFNNKIEEEPSKTKELIKPFINSLFQIFKQKKEGEKTAVDNIQVLNRKGELIPTSDVFLGKEYHFGKITEKLFEGIFQEGQYLISNEFWGLEIENQSIDYLDTFFIWLGVNKYTKNKNHKKIFNKWAIDEYTKFVFNTIGTPELFTTINYEISEIEYFNEIISNQIEIEKLIAWITLDKKIHSKLELENNGDFFSHSYYNNTAIVNLKPSYFLYQIAKSRIFENVFVDFEYADFLGLQSINPKHSTFSELGIADTAVIDTLKKLGAKMSFNDLTNEAVYNLLDSLNAKEVESKNARKIYQQAFSYFRNNKEIDYQSFKKQTHLLAVKNDKSEYKPTQEVYYSDNTTLPSKIIEDFWIFDFPKRSGEKQLAGYFGVKTFKDINIEIQEKNTSYHPKTEEFNGWFDKIKPYLLSYRLNNIKTIELTNTAVNSIKNCSIKIVSSLDYTIDGSEPKSLLPNEFINSDKHTFFIGADYNLNLEQLKDIPAFCEAFSEILCVLFEVNENKDDFRAIFKDKEHLKDSKYLIETKMLLDKYEEACQLLGLSKNEILFWKIITEGKINNFPEMISNTNQLQNIITIAINYQLPDDYNFVNFETFYNQPSYNFINDICISQELTLKDITTRHDSFPGLKHYHLAKLTQTAIDLEILWNKACWLDLSVKSKEEKMKFENHRNLYLQNRQEIIEKLSKKISWDIEVNYEDLFIKQLNAEFNIVIQKENLVDINLEYKYPKLIKQYDINTEELSSDLKSLLFFDGHEEELKVKFVELIKQEIETEETATEEGKTPITNAVITSIEVGIAPANKANNGLGNKKGGTHSHKRELQNMKAGKRAEKLVRDKLIELYPNGEIRWISGNSEDNSLKLDDSKGFDISYKKNKTDEHWKYLEVKSSSSGNSFIISANEVTVGIENNENYHLALVNGLNINFVEDFFLNETRLAEFNVLRNSASIRPLDYEVFYNISKTN